MAKRRGARPTITADDINGTSEPSDGTGIVGSDTGAGNSDTIDPATVARADSGSDNGSGGPGADRPRRKYTRRAGTQKAQKLSVDTLSFLLMSSHAMLAGMTKTPELELDDSEATQLGGALAVVNSFYNVEVADKTMAWVALAMVAGQIYGPRVVAIGVRRNGDRQARKTQAAPAPRTVNPAQQATDPLQTPGAADIYDNVNIADYTGGPMFTPGFSPIGGNPVH